MFEVVSKYFKTAAYLVVKNQKKLYNCRIFKFSFV